MPHVLGCAGTARVAMAAHTPLLGPRLRVGHSSAGGARPWARRGLEGQHGVLDPAPPYTPEHNAEISSTAIKNLCSRRQHHRAPGSGRTANSTLPLWPQTCVRLLELPCGAHDDRPSAASRRLPACPLLGIEGRRLARRAAPCRRRARAPGLKGRLFPGSTQLAPHIGR